MHPAIAQLIPLVIFLIPMLGLFGVIKYRDWQARKEARKNPLTSDLLRGPGESLREKIEELSISIDAYVTLLVAMPVLIYSMYLSQLVFAKTANLVSLVGFIIFAIGLIGYLLRKVLTTMNLRRKYVLGLDVEIATGQELNQLMRDRFWVFHDFPAGKFNIDHVVIGETGVFAVETKGRSKLMRNDGSAEREVLYDGATLQFPGWVETKPIQQAERQAKWLQDWLTRAVGEPVSVQPLIALPGWYVKRTRAGGIPVINGKNCSSFFLKFNNGNKLSEKLQTQIAHNVEQRCRNVLPRAYRIEDE